MTVPFERLLVWVRARGLLLLPAALAIVAGLLAWGALRARSAEARAGWELVEVVVAAEALSAGQVVGSADLAKREIPERFASSSVIRPQQLRLVVGQRLEAPLQAGDPVLWSHFSTVDGRGGLAQAVQTPGRAVTLQIGEAASVGGWVRPNDHVDVISTFRDPVSHELATVTLLQNVLVLAMGAAGDVGGSAGHATVLVLPEEAELLVLAQEMGSLSLVLRHPEDLEVRNERVRTTVQTLLTGERSAELQRRRHATIQVIRGKAGQSSIDRGER
jgi:pilus assembly protein CpaB